MTIAQFLGAFNDSVFKQLVLLITAQVLVVSGSVVRPVDQQDIAQAIFAIAFVMFSGVAGYWADRIRKRSIIVAAKVAEIGVMLAAVAGFAVMMPRLVTTASFSDNQVAIHIEGGSAAPIMANHAPGEFAMSEAGGGFEAVAPRDALIGDRVLLPRTGEQPPGKVKWGDVILEKDSQTSVRLTQGIPWLLLLVVLLMGTQSAWFGPAKYGILPEMLRASDLPRVNGIFLMTTFVAVVLGFVTAGVLLDQFGDSLWKAGLVCVGIAVVGAITSLAVRPTPAAQPRAPFRLRDLGISSDTWHMLAADRPLCGALAVYAVFWFVAAVVPMAVNTLGLNVLELSALETSLMFSCVCIGIAVGCVLAGRLSRSTVNFAFVRIGSWGLILCLGLLAVPGLDRSGSLDFSGHLLGYYGSQVALTIAGFFAGLFAVPLQVYIQAKPPEAFKGRMIGTMNLVNWIAIILSAAFYFGTKALIRELELPLYFTFAAIAVLLLPVALLYRPANVEL